MTTAELRAQRRAHREALEAAESAKRARRRRFAVLGGAVAAAVAAILVAALVSTGSHATAAPSDTLTPSTVVAGVPEHHGVLGDPHAPVTVTEYVDLQCPICAEASTATLPSLIDRYVKTGKVKLRMRTLSFLGPDSATAARMAAGAQQQDKLWSFAETLYANQGAENSAYVTEAYLRKVATTAGMNPDRALAYAKTGAAGTALVEANRDARAVGANATPTFTIKKDGRPERILQVGEGDVSSALEKAL